MSHGGRLFRFQGSATISVLDHHQVIGSGIGLGEAPLLNIEVWSHTVDQEIETDELCIFNVIISLPDNKERRGTT